ncbi:hypothetical protein [Neorhizobium sp. NCHU2750]|uniref:hypothetical protein n=1 Tax=Neorhizobium sp. NCHU2750 TaxID=1825976 RepID=UPI000EB78B56|nr:hypothetical protein NCHU2750_59160 [Neorhizobium sp. NCHU2750]
MADSENSRTVPAITCRNSLNSTEWFLTAQIADQSRFPRGAGNDALALWRAWLLAFERVDRLNAAQQRLEAELLAASSLNVCPEDVGLLSRVSVMAMADQHVCAYSRAEQAANDGADIEDRTAADLCEADVTSIVAVVAKLHCVLQRGQPGVDFDESPWPELRRILRDLLNICGRIGDFRHGDAVLPIDSG